jgi:hypothetical protein
MNGTTGNNERACMRRTLLHHGSRDAVVRAKHDANRALAFDTLRACNRRGARPITRRRGSGRPEEENETGRGRDTTRREADGRDGVIGLDACVAAGRIALGLGARASGGLRRGGDREGRPHPEPDGSERQRSPSDGTAYRGAREAARRGGARVGSGLEGQRPGCAGIVGGFDARVVERKREDQVESFARRAARGHARILRLQIGDRDRRAIGGQRELSIVRDASHVLGPARRAAHDLHGFPGRGVELGDPNAARILDHVVTGVRAVDLETTSESTAQIEQSARGAGRPRVDLRPEPLVGGGGVGPRDEGGDLAVADLAVAVGIGGAVEAGPASCPPVDGGLSISRETMSTPSNTSPARAEAP